MPDEATHTKRRMRPTSHVNCGQKPPRGIITTAEELGARHSSLTLLPATANTGAIDIPIHVGEPLRIKPPEDGMTYGIDEVARICKVHRTTVHRYASAGVRVRVEIIRLQKLAVPRGRIAPAALCAFLSRVNGVTVKVDYSRSRPGG